MFTNRFFNSLVIVALAVVAVLLVREAHATAAPVAEMDSATRSYIAWGEALEKAKLNALDSGTRSYIAWGEALEAAGKLDNSGACSNPMPENIFAGIPNNVDSATRSYIAWGLALQAKNDFGALCR